MPRSALSGLLVALLASCATTTLPAYTPNVPPRFDDVRPPHRSLLSLSTSLPLDGLEEALDQATSRVLDRGGQASLRGLPLHADIHLERGPATLRAVAGGIELAVVAQGRVEVSAGPVRCSSDDVHIETSALGRPQLSGDTLMLAADAKLSTRVTGTLACAGFKVPLEPVLSPVLRELTSGMEKLLWYVRVPIGPVLKRALGELATPRPLVIEGRAACLVLAPAALVVSPVQGHGSTLEVGLGVDVAPRVLVGECPQKRAGAVSTVYASDQPVADEMSIEVAVAVPVDALQPALTSALVGRSFGQRAITVDSAVLGDAGGHLLLHTHVHGAFNGDLFLWGTPTFVSRDGRLFVDVPDVEVAYKTKALLERFALAIWSRIHGDFTDQARHRLHFDVTDRVQALVAHVPPEIERATLDEHVLLHVDVRRVEPVEVLSRPGLVVPIVRVVAHATATVR